VPSYNFGLPGQQQQEMAIDSFTMLGKGLTYSQHFNTPAVVGAQIICLPVRGLPVE
jgi:hypothetical protein